MASQSSDDYYKRCLRYPVRSEIEDILRRPWLARRVQKVLKCSDLTTDEIYIAIPTVLHVAGGRIQFELESGEGWFRDRPLTPDLEAILETRSPGHWHNLLVHVAVKTGLRTWRSEPKPPDPPEDNKFGFEFVRSLF
jgi:hypothetical protein